VSFRVAQAVPDLEFLSAMLRERSEIGRLRQFNQYMAEYLPRQRSIEHMKEVYRGTPGPVRSSFSFGVSGCVHGCVLAWVILGGSGPPRERAQSIYDRELRPYEKKIVWYSLQEKLPEIAPADKQADARAARARVKAPQTMVAGARDDVRPAPLIWAPEPEVATPKEMPLPNVVAGTPKVVRPF